MRKPSLHIALLLVTMLSVIPILAECDCTQIIERIKITGVFSSELQWKAQVWGGDLIGDSGWYTLDDVESHTSESYFMPALDGSRLLIGISEENDASLPSDFAATAY